MSTRSEELQRVSEIRVYEASKWEIEKIGESIQENIANLLTELIKEIIQQGNFDNDPDTIPYPIDQEEIEEKFMELLEEFNQFLGIEELIIIENRLVEGYYTKNI